MTLLCSVEVCLRLYRETKRETDPDLDNLTNPHEVKHWMDPKIIPFGWGLFGEQDEVIIIETGLSIKRLNNKFKLNFSADTDSLEMAEMRKF